MLIFWRNKLQNLTDIVQQVDGRINTVIGDFQNIKNINLHIHIVTGGGGGINSENDEQENLPHYAHTSTVLKG